MGGKTERCIKLIGKSLEKNMKKGELSSSQVGGKGNTRKGISRNRGGKRNKAMKHREKARSKGGEVSPCFRGQACEPSCTKACSFQMLRGGKE